MKRSDDTTVNARGRAPSRGEWLLCTGTENRVKVLELIIDLKCLYLEGLRKHVFCPLIEFLLNYGFNRGLYWSVLKVGE